MDPECIQNVTPLQPFHDDVALAVPGQVQKLGMLKVTMMSPQRSSAQSIWRNKGSTRRAWNRRNAFHLSTVRTKKYVTVDSYDDELDVDKESMDEDKIWAGQKMVTSQGIPEAVWSSHQIDQTPPAPERWIGKLADKVEIQRLCSMGILVPADQFDGQIPGRLTTKFVGHRWWFQEALDEKIAFLRQTFCLWSIFGWDKKQPCYSPTKTIKWSWPALMFVMSLFRWIKVNRFCVIYKFVYLQFFLREAFTSNSPQFSRVWIEIQGFTFWYTWMMLSLWVEKLSGKTNFFQRMRQKKIYIYIFLTSNWLEVETA